MKSRHMAVNVDGRVGVEQGVGGPCFRLVKLQGGPATERKLMWSRASHSDAVILSCGSTNRLAFPLTWRPNAIALKAEGRRVEQAGNILKA